MEGNQRYEVFFERWRMALTAALEDPDVSAALAKFGYDAERIQDLLALLDEAEAQYRKQKVEYAEKFTATQVLQEQRAALRQTLSRHRRLARVMFKNGSAAYNALDLGGRTERGHVQLVQQALHFYEYLLEDPSVLQELSDYAITREVAEQGVADAKGVREAHQARAKETKEAEMATERRDDLFMELRGRMADFFEVTRVAMEMLDLPDVSEAMGLPDREG